MTVYDIASELYNEYLEIYFDEYKTLPNVREKTLGNKYDPINLFLEPSNNDVWFENEKLTYTTTKSDLPPTPDLECDGEKVKQGK